MMNLNAKIARLNAPTEETGAPTQASTGWTFFSNHAHVLIAIANEPGLTLKEVADQVGITERAVQRVVAELEAGGYLQRSKEGRKNTYSLHMGMPLRHQLEAHCSIGQLIDFIVGRKVVQS